MFYKNSKCTQQLKLKHLNAIVAFEMNQRQHYIVLHGTSDFPFLTALDLYLTLCLFVSILMSHHFIDACGQPEAG